MVNIMENPVKMDDLRVTPTIFGNIHIGGGGFTYLFGIFTPIPYIWEKDPF